MSHLLAALLAILHIALPLLSPQQLTRKLRSGEWLRFHVIAQDDSDTMQQLKLNVRDAVQACYLRERTDEGSMQEQAGRLLPLLTQSAVEAAESAGFDGKVCVSLDVFSFDERDLAGQRVPAGDYPALMIRLGDAQGRNWWGLLDPETSLTLAGGTLIRDEPILWDWSWRALLRALLGLPLTQGA